MVGDNGDNLEQKKPDGTCETDKEGHLGTLHREGKDYKVVNSVTVIEILVHKLEDGREVQQVVAQEFMMTEHKTYMLRLLTDAIMTVARARKRTSLVKPMTEALFNKLRKAGRLQGGRIKDMFRRKR